MLLKDFLYTYCIVDKYGAHTKSNDIYIGSSHALLKYLAEHEITEIYSYHDFRKTNKSCVACCGFSKKEQRWYGWTHRGIRSFGIGDKYFSYLGGKPAKTLEECKKLAFYAVQELD